MYTIIHSQQSGKNRMNETSETDLNSTLLDVNYIKNNNSTTNTTDSTNIYQNHQHRQPVSSTELTQNSDPLSTTKPILPNVNTPLPRLHTQNSVHFNTEPLTFNNSTQPNPHKGLTKIFKSLHKN